jgi:hypothetical protein
VILILAALGWMWLVLTVPGLAYALFCLAMAYMVRPDWFHKR